MRSVSRTWRRHGYRITGEGTGGIAGFAKGVADVRLEESAEGTLLTYRANAQVGGKLAQLGGRLVDGVAKKMADEFFAALAGQLGGQRTEASEAAAEEIRPAAPPDRAGFFSSLRAWIGAWLGRLGRMQ